MNDKQIIAISGTRKELSANARNKIDEVLSVLDKSITFIHYGDCPTGVDEYIDNEYIANGWQGYKFKANWKKFGKKAGPIRNKNMLFGATKLFAFPVPTSKGTFNAIKQAREAGIEIVTTYLENKKATEEQKEETKKYFKPLG